jgi:hypothetical protein
MLNDGNIIDAVGGMAATKPCGTCCTSDHDGSEGAQSEIRGAADSDAT